MGTSDEPRTRACPTGVATSTSCRSGDTDAIGHAADLPGDDPSAAASAYANTHAHTPAYTGAGAYTDADARACDETSDDASADASARASADASACACPDAWAYAVGGICGHIYDCISIHDHSSEYDIHDEWRPV